MFARRFTLLLSCVFLAGVSLPSQAAELKPESVNAWNAWLQFKEAQLAQRPSVSPAESADAAQLRVGAIIVRPANHSGSFPVPSALIHDWIGTVFIPDVSLQDVLAGVRSYENYPKFYQPSVVRANLIASHADSDRYSVVMRQDVLTIKTGLVGEYVSEYHQVDAAHWYSLTHSCRLQEITKYGSENEELLDPNEGNGFIWRIYSEIHYEQADGGVYLQFEAAALSRTVPRALAWAVNPVIERISRSALTTTLRQTRDAIQVVTAHR